MDGDIPGGPVAKTPHSQYRGPGFEPWFENWIPLAATKNSHAMIKDPTGHNSEFACEPRPITAKLVLENSSFRKVFL